MVNRKRPKNEAHTKELSKVDASEFPSIPEFDVSNGIPLDANAFKKMIQNVAFAASVDDSRPVLTGVLMNMDGKSASMVATDGSRLAIHKVELPVTPGKTQLIIPASALKEVVRILGATKANKTTLFLPATGSQVVLRCENVQIKRIPQIFPYVIYGGIETHYPHI